MLKEEIVINGYENIIQKPSICPCCGLGINPEILTYSSNSSDTSELGVVYACPACHKVFFAKYTWIQGYFSFSAIYPHEMIKLSIPMGIKESYPVFYRLYAQSAYAEAHHLIDICGMGYRKAVETLVKQYLQETFPEEKGKILSEPLGSSIKRIPYPKIQVLAKAATWIGNDETHIVKKNPDYGIPEMKSFILALCHLILAEKASDEALTMTEK